MIVREQDSIIRAAVLEWWGTIPDDEMIKIVLDDVVCPGGRPCPDDEIEGMLRIGGRDMTHFTPEGSQIIAPTLIDRALER